MTTPQPEVLPEHLPMTTAAVLTGDIRLWQVVVPGFHHGLFRHLRRPGQRPRHLVAHRALGPAPDRDHGRHGRRCLPR
jgi:hypothetical protein